jgi:hypothetical protein
MSVSEEIGLIIDKPSTTKLSREMRRLDGFFNPTATKMYNNLTKSQNEPTETTETIETTNDSENQPEIHLDQALALVTLKQTATINPTNPYNVSDHQLKDILKTPVKHEDAF